MLAVRSAQIRVFDDAAWQQFEDEMVIHSREFSPRLCEVLGEKQVRVAVGGAIQRARAFGFTCRGPVRLYVELMFLCGSGFATDPQYPILGKVLLDSADQMARAERLHEEVLRYQEKVAGPDACNVRRALGKLLGLSQKPVAYTREGLVAGLLGDMHEGFPERAGYIGDAALTALIAEGRAEAQKHEFPSPRGEALLVTLMFAFGHECTHDPLYPWIERTLQDEKIVAPAARAARLERKAVTWLNHVLDQRPAGDS
ncbi:MAG: hypothetical protein U1G07_07085 [Verrucomicrobiota bacterium]